MNISPVFLVVALIAGVVFPPLLLVVVPLIITLVVVNKRQIDRGNAAAHTAALAKRRADAIKGFCS